MTFAHPPADPLDVFLGDATPVAAVVYARLPALAEFHAGRLDGVLVGPHASTSRMLPAKYSLVDCGAGSTRLARAMIPDPCYWSAELPALYELRVEWRVGDEVRASWNRTVGLRRIGARRQAIFYDGRRWVLRGVWRASSCLADWSAWRDAPAVCLADNLSDDDLRTVSEIGAPLVARVARNVVDPVAEVRRLARWPAVLGVIVALDPGETAPVEELRRAAAGALLFQPCDDPANVADWADGLLVDVGGAARGAAAIAPFVSVLRPVIATRALAAALDLAMARAACDDLQRDLAPYGDFAGYVV